MKQHHIFTNNHKITKIKYHNTWTNKINLMTNNKMNYLNKTSKVKIRICKKNKLKKTNQSNNKTIKPIKPNSNIKKNKKNLKSQTCMVTNRYLKTRLSNTAVSFNRLLLNAYLLINNHRMMIFHVNKMFLRFMTIKIRKMMKRNR